MIQRNEAEPSAKPRPPPNSPRGWKKISRKVSPPSPARASISAADAPATRSSASTGGSNAAPRVAIRFPNDASLLCLVSALLAELSEEWETGKIHLNRECPTQPPVNALPICRKYLCRREM